MLRRTAFAATLAAAALALSACTGSTATPNADATSSAAADPDATLTVGLVLEPTTLDIRRSAGAPIEQALIDNVYEGLVTRTPDNDVVDKLASAHEVSADGLTYTFTLTEGATFHDGSPVTTADVVSSFEAARSDKKINGNATFAKVSAVTATDDKTVTLTLTEPDQNLLFNLTGPGGLVFKTDDDTDMKKAENGTGPFTLEQWKKGDSITLARFDDYWGDKAGVKEVVLQYIPDFTSGVNAALQDQVQVLTAVDPTLAPQFDGTDFTVTEGKTTDKATLAFNNKRAPLDDPRVRKALRMAIDHEGLLAAIGGNKALGGPIPELDPGYEDLTGVAPYDPAEAKKLLAEAGQEKLKLTLKLPSFYGTTIPQVLISDFNKVGVTLDVKPMEYPTWLTDVYQNKDYDLSYVLHVEPRDFSNWANPDYYFGYDNAKVQDLYTQAMSATDEKTSNDLLKKAARIVSEDAAADWLYVGTTLTAVLPEVHGFPVDSINARIDLAPVTVSK